MFGVLYDLFDRVKKLNEGEAWVFSIDRNVQDEIIRLNTEDQLEEEGIDSLGRKLGDYSPYTVQIKKEKGQRYDHITLKDTGAFYRSFRVIVKKTGFEIIADDSSKYDVPLTDVFGLDVLGLTEQNKQWLYDFLIERYHEYVEQKIFQ